MKKLAMLLMLVAVFTFTLTACQQSDNGGSDNHSIESVWKIEEGKGVLDGQVIFLSYHVDLRRHGIGGDESVADSRGRRGPPLGNGMGFQHVQGDHC